MDFSVVLSFFKNDIGICHNQKDEFYMSYIQSRFCDLQDKGIALNLNSLEDQMLLSDFSVWEYRNRKENLALSKSLQLRIRNRIVKKRSETSTDG